MAKHRASGTADQLCLVRTYAPKHRKAMVSVGEKCDFCSGEALYHTAWNQIITHYCTYHWEIYR